MTARNPLVMVAGQVREIAATDVLAPLSTGARLASSFPFDQTAGRYFDNSAVSHNGGTLAGAAGRIDLAPMIAPRSVTVDQIGVAVSTAVAASLVRALVYDADQATGRPTNRLLSSADLSGAAAAFVSTTVAFTLQAGRLYWVGTHHSSTCTLRTVAVTGGYQLGLAANNGAGVATVVRQTVAFGASSPATWTWADANLTAAITPPSVRFRVASVAS